MAFSKPKAHERAERYAAKGQHDKAAREYQVIVEHDPKDIRAWLMLADCLVRCGDKAGAVERYERVAQYYVEAKEHNKALAVYRQVLALDAQRLDVQVKMAALNLQVGHTQDGIAIYERVAHAQLQLGRVADALTTYKLVADADPTVVARRLRLAELYSREKRNAEAVEAFRAAGRQLRLLGRLTDYVRVAERLLYHDENDLPTVRDTARAYLELGDPRRALLKLNGLLRAHPKDEEGIELLADTFMALGKPEKALSALEELARALRAKGPAAKADAIRVLRRGLEWRPAHAEFREALTELEGRRRDPTPVTMPTAPPVADAQELTIDVVDAVDDGDLVELDDDDVEMDELEPGPGSGTISLPEAASSAPGARRTVEVEALPSTEPSLTQSVLSEVEASADLAGQAYAREGVDPESLTDFDKVLFEARTYIKYRLFEHALEHVSLALRQQPQNVAALAVQAKALAELGRSEEAAESHLTLVELVAGRDPKLAREHLAAARELSPRNPRLEPLARSLGSAGPGRVSATARPRAASFEDDGDSGAFDVVGTDFGEGNDLSPPGIALDLADEPRANLAPAEEDVHTTQPFTPLDIADASAGRPGRGPTVAVGRRPTLGEPARTGRTLSPLVLEGPSRGSHDLGRAARGPDGEPTPGGRTPARDVDRPPTRRTLGQMPTVDEDGVTTGLDFDGELDLDVDTEPRRDGPPAAAPSEISMSDMEIDVELDEPASTPRPGPSMPRPKPSGAPTPVLTHVARPATPASKPAPASKPVPTSKPAPASKPAAPPPAAPLAPARRWLDLSDELEEIQFYVDQGLDDDAEAALDDLEAIHPGHPQIAKFRRREPIEPLSDEPEAAEAEAAGAEAVEVEAEPEAVEVEAEPEEVEPEPEPEPEPAAVSAEPEDEPDHITQTDLAASMLELDLEPEVAVAAAEPLVSLDDDEVAAEPLVGFADDDDEDAYLSAIFADPVKPKAKPRTEESTPGANVAAGQAVDAATAFDLGVAYREMGLVDAAIAQFETAAADPQWRARALTLLGALRVHRGETDRAITDLKEAVRLASTPAEASEAAYELGVLYGVIGDTEAAIQHLLTVAPGYRDRDERLSDLGF